MLVVLDTVYPVLDTPENVRGTPSFEFPADTLNIYVSNKVAKPANAAAMTLDDSSPYTAGIYGRNKRARWILFSAAVGNPVVNEFGIIKLT